MLGPIAQSVEQRTFNPWVDGSSPSGPTKVYFFLVVVRVLYLRKKSPENTIV